MKKSTVWSDYIYTAKESYVSADGDKQQSRSSACYFYEDQQRQK